MNVGCSVSYGDACWGEDVFVHVLAEKMHGDYINAACSGYGLAGMLLKVKELVPKYKPDYLVVQYTKWLAERSMQQYQSFFGGEFPMPYFSDKQLEAPVFLPKGLGETPFAEFHSTPYGQVDILRFMGKVAPYFIYEDFHRMIAFFKGLVDINPPASKDTDVAEAYAFAELNRICKENNVKMIVWTTGTGFNLDPKLPPKVVYDQKVPVAYADSALYKKGNTWDKESYSKRYSHWETNYTKDTVLLDGHPNPLAHRIIAEEIFETIQRSDSLDKLAGKP